MKTLNVDRNWETTVPCYRISALTPSICSVKKQVVVRQALREWFEAVRGGSEGVRGAQLVDAVVTLGLNNDYKQVTDARGSARFTHRMPTENSKLSCFFSSPLGLNVENLALVDLALVDLVRLKSESRMRFRWGTGL